jgi:hypothetical protein
MSNQGNVLRFRAGLKGWGNLSRQQALTAQRRIGMELFAEVTRQWPVDTGRSRYAWNASTGSPDTSIPPEGQYAAPAAPAFSGLKLGEAVYITNAVPYAAALNEGHSGQMPAGTVERSLERVVGNWNAGGGGGR